MQPAFRHKSALFELIGRPNRTQEVAGSSPASSIAPEPHGYAFSRSWCQALVARILATRLRNPVDAWFESLVSDMPYAALQSGFLRRTQRCTDARRNRENSPRVPKSVGCGSSVMALRLWVLPGRRAADRDSVRPLRLRARHQPVAREQPRSSSPSGRTARRDSTAVTTTAAIRTA